MSDDKEALRPSEASEPTWFDRFASVVSDSVVAKAWFFVLCVLMVVVWFPTLFVMDINTSQLIINTLTTIVTFLLVALLQNTQSRDMKSIHRKLNAIAEGLIDVMEANEADTSAQGDIEELAEAVGLEQKEGT